jgi:iron complex transport system substrate-binding protein
MLFTGADMDNLAVVKKSFKEMEVTALVTAGVETNAMRMGADEGLFYEPERAVRTKPGTINVLLLTNMQLSPGAMTRAIISATEAKTAALQDMDIRSSASPLLNQATGTGTDNIIVVEGAGLRIDSSGGHTKMGELMARAVYEGVRKAIFLQNGLVTDRSVFQRLKERKISLHDICVQYAGHAESDQGGALYRQTELILLQPAYAAFLKDIMALSDDYEKGLIKDLTGVDSMCAAMAGKIAGKEIGGGIGKIDGLPVVMAKGLAAVVSGALEKTKKKSTGE